MVWRGRYFLIGGVALIIVAGGLIGWHFWDGRGEVLKPGGGPVVTVMDFSQSFRLDAPDSRFRVHARVTGDNSV